MEQKQIFIVAAVIRNEKGEILLAKRHQPNHPEADGKWEFVGGGIEFGEEPEQALIREVKEESGLNVKVIRLLPKIFTDRQQGSNGEDFQIIILTYECKVVGGELSLKDEEIAELKFVKFEDVKNYNAFNNIHQTVNFLNT